MGRQNSGKSSRVSETPEAINNGKALRTLSDNVEMKFDIKDIYISEFNSNLLVEGYDKDIHDTLQKTILKNSSKKYNLIQTSNYTYYIEFPIIYSSGISPYLIGENEINNKYSILHDFEHKYITQVSYNVYIYNHIHRYSRGIDARQYLVIIGNNPKQILMDSIPLFKKAYDTYQNKYYGNKIVDYKYLNGVILDKDLKKEILSDLDSFLSSRNVYKEIGIPWKRGYIFNGPPGNGKTSFLRQLAKVYNFEAKNILDFIDIHGNLQLPTDDESQVEFPGTFSPGDYFCDSESNRIKKLYYLEDLEKVVGRSGDTARIKLDDLLNSIDGIDKLKDGFLFVATTNNIGGLYEPLVGRPGRFDRIYTFDIPKYEQINEYMKYHNIKVTGCDIANELDGLSMAFVEEFVKSAKMYFKKSTFKKSEVKEIIDKLRSHQKMRSDYSNTKDKLGFQSS